MVLALTLVVGLVTHGIGGAGVGLKSAIAASADDMPMSGKCDGCGDDQNGMAAACKAYCSSVVALSVALVVTDIVPIDILRPAPVSGMAGRIVPPDPYPPRTIGLS